MCYFRFNQISNLLLIYKSTILVQRSDLQYNYYNFKDQSPVLPVSETNASHILKYTVGRKKNTSFIDTMFAHLKC